MKKFRMITVFAVVLALLFAVASCGRTESDNGTKVERPELEMPTVSPHIVYPEKPSEKPATPPAGTLPSVKSYASSQAESGYTVTTEQNVTEIGYSEVTDWAYVYAAVENYSSAYGNIKITIRNESGAQAAERITIQALYYEAYDLGYAPVTVYAGELAAGEQYVVAELGEFLITDKAYNKIKGQSVKDKTIIGFVIFIDSLPTYAPSLDANGSLEITAFEFLADGDPKLEDRYVKPVADFENATADEGVNVVKGETLAFTLTGDSGSVRLPVEKYTSADFAKFTVVAEGAADSAFDIALGYTLDGGKTKAVSSAQTVTLTGEESRAEYDFTAMRPTSGGDDLTTQFIKNGTITEVILTPTVANAQITVKSITFERTVSDGGYVSDVWSEASDVSVERAERGGNAKISYAYYTAWFNISVPVRKGEGVNKLQLVMYDPDGLTHLGVGITTSSPNSSGGQNAGTFILRGALDVVDKAAAPRTITETGMKGIVETCAYDVETKLFTITFDFTNMDKDGDDKTFADYSITSVLFYLNCADDNAEHEFDGKHTLYFLSIDLL